MLPARIKQSPAAVTVQIAELLSRLDKVRPTGQGKWISCCPAHEDRSPSLSIKTCSDGRILMHCFASCEVDDIAGAIGLTLSDLMPETNNFVGSRLQSQKADMGVMLEAVVHELTVALLMLENSGVGCERLATCIGRINRARCQFQEKVAPEIRQIRKGVKGG